MVPGSRERFRVEPGIPTAAPALLDFASLTIRYPSMNAGSVWRFLVYAVIRTGGKQYRVAEGDTLRIERDILENAKDGAVSFGEILMIGGDEPQVGAPLVEGASVKATVLGEVRGDKIIVFRKKRRKQYKKKQGHRQDLVEVRIDTIQA